MARRDLTDHGMPMDTYQLWATTGLVDMGHGKQHPKDTVQKQSIIHDGWTLLERATHPRDPQSHPPSIANGPRRDGWRWQPIATACNATGRGRAWLAGIAPVPSSASSWLGTRTATRRLEWTPIRRPQSSDQNLKGQRDVLQNSPSPEKTRRVQPAIQVP